MRYHLILATDKNSGIGYQGDMLFYISEDLKRFKRFTTDNIIVMEEKHLYLYLALKNFLIE